jgi:signal transduction histidine kinase
MEFLIRDLLAFSRAAHGESELRELSLDECLQSILIAIRDSITEAGATVVAKTLPTVMGDRQQLEQVLQNLLSNALKYRQTDVAPEVRISAARQSGEWVIAVADNGIGFEPKYAERIFGLFKRLHGEKYPGTGLGLAICERVIGRHGGRIWAESEPGRGTTLYFTLRSP